MDPVDVSAPEGPFSLSIADFIALEREQAEPLITDTDGRVLIARKSLTLLGGLGGGGKTTFFVELALHLAAGVDYLGFKIPAPASVLLIENEGPEEMFAAKLEAKLASFEHELEKRVAVCTVDWGGFTLGDGTIRERLREDIVKHEYDLIFGDPLDSLGIEGVGSPADTRKFLERLKETGLHSEVAWWLNTHPRKEETKEALNEIAGAWGGKPDAVLLLNQLDDDRSRLRFPKLRWAKRGKRPAILLAFDPDTESFTYIGEEGDEERDYVVEIRTLLHDAKWRTAREIAAPKNKGGIGANIDTIKKVLGEHPDEFESRTGEAAKEVKRSPTATVWQVCRKVTQTQKSPESPSDFAGEDEGGDSVTPPYRSHQESGHLTPEVEGDSEPKSPSRPSDHERTDIDWAAA
jgi:hypothetical protein